MKQRTKEFTLRVLKLVDANYRAPCRAKSRADFVHKTSIVEKEADESCFWLEITIDAALLPAKRVQPLLREANELTAIIVASRKTAISRSRR